ncbi:MAG: hypothetical protein RI924_1127 [Bacteroidota bacterium]|jgi:beta-mannosidase
MKKSIALLLIFYAFSLFALAQKTTISLIRNWNFRQADQDKAYPATVPGTVHTDLLQQELIPDPFFGENEQKVQWVEQKSWIYETRFDVPVNELAKSKQELVFEGLDTYARVYLNGKEILSADNMFRTWTLPVKGLLKAKGNQLKIVFEPVNPRTISLATQLPYTLPGGENVFIRKAQYQFGWDWGPRLVTCGIWKPIQLVCWNDNRIKEVQVLQRSLNEELAVIDLMCSLNEPAKKTLVLQTSFSDAKTKTKAQAKIAQGEQTGIIHLEVSSPQFWWSNGLGKAHLYQLDLKLKDQDKTLDSYQSEIGLRTIEIVQNKDSLGSGFQVQLNGVPVFMKGANIIPTDSFMPRTSLSVYEQLVEEAKESNMNMLRVWGGGVYGDDAFYRLCDRNGILVWQDFMFAGSPYPADEAFLNNVATEIKEQVIRLRNHPSLALWCGNNEISEGWFNWGWQKQYQYSPADSANIKAAYDRTFEQFIPSILNELDPGRFYHPSSPANGWGRMKSYQEADVHYWGVWWGMEPFENYEKKVGRFVSEYGFQGMPAYSSLSKYLEEKDRYLISPALKNHQKHGRGFETISSYMERDYPMPTSLEDYAYLSQLLQTRGMKTAIEAHRRAMPYCMGSLYWQLNDCWPVTSWSTLDYYGMPKAAHYQLKSLFKNLMISVSGEANQKQIHVVSDRLTELTGSLDWQVLSFEGKVLYQQILPIQIEANSAKVYAEIDTKNIPDFDPSRSVLLCQLVNEEGTLAEQVYYFARDKDLNLSKAQISLKKLSKDSFLLTAERLARGVYVSWEDRVAEQNYFDLMPGETKIIRFKRATDQVYPKGMPVVITLNEVLGRLKN